MKIVLHIVESFGGGVYSWIREVCKHTYSDVKHNLIFSIRSDTPNSFVEEFIGTESIEVKMNREISPLNDLSSFTNIKKLINSIQPIIIHCHSSKAGFITRILRPFIKQKAIVIYTPHGISFERKDISILSRIFYILLENFACLFSRTVLCCSKSEGQIYKKFVPLAKCSYIENFCDTKKFEPFFENRLNRLSHVSKQGLKVVTVGGIRKQKNPEQFAIIAKSLQGQNIQFIWVGDGAPADVLRLQESGVKVTGWLTSDEVKQILSDSDIYLQTSLWEGMPIAVIEAMAAGLPCVVSNIPGNTDCVNHGVDGYIYNKESEAVESILSFSDRNKLIKFSKFSRKTAENRFSTDIFINKLTKFYQNQLG